jgi:beta-N-acetylhexosaminidase
MQNFRSSLLNVPAVKLLGECIMPRLQIEQFTEDSDYAERTIQLVRDHKVGGFCVFGGSPDIVVRVIQTLQAEAESAHGVPLIFSADCEFGLPMRFKSDNRSGSGTEFPDAMAIGRTGDPELARDVGRAIAKEMKSIGIAWNFAPVADVNSNPANPIINTRSFGEQPEIVSRFAVPFMLGLEEEGVAAAAKHFPGHGDTSVDSHQELPFVDGGIDRFQSTEFPPFEALIGAGVRSIMTGHLAAPQLAEFLGASLEDRFLPATLSRTLTTTLLRDRMGFEGAIVTDSLEMKGVTDLFGEAEVAIRAFEAGADILLMPPDPALAYDTLATALLQGRITEEQIQEKILRVLKLKKFAALEAGQIGIHNLIGLEQDHATLAGQVAKQAIEEKGTIDLRDANLVVIVDDRPEAISKAQAFSDRVATIFRSSQLETVSEWDETSEWKPNTVLVTVHRARGYLGGTATNASMPRIMAHLAKKILTEHLTLKGLVLFGSPYLDSELRAEPGFVLKTFSESSASIEAVLQKLLAVQQP